MTEFVQVSLQIILYRIITILVGFGIIYLGYLLFRIGVYEKAGDLKAAWGDSYLTLKQATPGTFFALFGAIIISISLWQGIDIEKVKSIKSSGMNQSAPSWFLEPISAIPTEVRSILKKLCSWGANY